MRSAGDKIADAEMADRGELRKGARKGTPERASVRVVARPSVQADARKGSGEGPLVMYLEKPKPAAVTLSPDDLGERSLAEKLGAPKVLNASEVSGRCTAAGARGDGP